MKHVLKFLSRKLLLTAGIVVADVQTSGQLTWKGVSATAVYVAMETVLDALKPKQDSTATPAQ